MHASPIRPRWLRAVLCAAAVLAPWPAIAADDWVQGGQGPGGASSNPDQTAIAAADLPALGRRWSRELDAWGGPTGVAISDGELYVTRRVRDRDGFMHSQLFRLDLVSGRTAWKTNSVESYATPLVTPDRVIVGGTGVNVDVDKTLLRAFDRDTGERRWHHTFPGAGNTVLAPHLKDGVVYLATVHGDLAALAPSTGALHWARRIDFPCCDLSGMVVEGGMVVVSQSHGLIGLDAADGRERWRYETGSNGFVAQRPMIVRGTAYAVDGSGYVHAVDLATGERRWKRLAPHGDVARGMAPLAGDGQRVYVLSGVVRPSLSALDPATGDVLWNVHRPGAWSQGLMVSNGVLYLGTLSRVLAFDAGTGAALPMARLRADRWSELAIAQGHLVVSGGPVEAYALTDSAR